MRYIINTLGCKVNQYETQAIDSILRDRGHKAAAKGESADVVIVNSCAVTAESGRKSRQALRALKQRHPEALSVICGCWSQVESTEALDLGADIVSGSTDRLKLIDDIERALSSRESILNIDKPFERRQFERLPSGAFSEHTRAYLKIEDGCANFCTYCIIPYARGGVRSLPLSECVAEAVSLAERGYKEIVLTGIELSSYGKDLKDGTALIDTICAIAEAVPSVRLRLGSLEPTVASDEFCRRLAQYNNICGHFHLSLQSGSDSVLKRMNRHYDTAVFSQCANNLRRHFPDCALSADVIVGFPGETETEHEESLRFVECMAFYSVHVFPYSKRKGTPAATMPNQLTKAEKSQRASELTKAADLCKTAYLQSCIGRTLSVLFENETEGMSVGHAENYAQVSVCGAHKKGVVKSVKIIDISGEMLVGVTV